jgi:hypothetical protein
MNNKRKMKKKINKKINKWPHLACQAIFLPIPASFINLLTLVAVVGLSNSVVYILFFFFVVVLQKIKTKTNKKITDKTSGTVQQASLPERSLSLYFSDKTKTHHWPRGLLSANSIAPMSTVLQCQSMQRKRTYRLASSRIQEGVNLLVLHPHELTLSPLLFSVCFK